MSEPTIFFAGDPHGVFDPLIEAVLEHRPDALVILGDMGLERPLDEVLAPIPGITQVYWIPGNHDGDRDEWHDHLFGSGLADRNLHGRVFQVPKIRIAGLGGRSEQEGLRPEAPNGMPMPMYGGNMSDNDPDFSGLLASLPHAGELHKLDRETRRRFKAWLWDWFDRSDPPDTRAWEFIKELNRLEDRDAIEDGADRDEVYARNEFIPAEVVRRLRESPDFQKAIKEAARRWDQWEMREREKENDD